MTICENCRHLATHSVTIRVDAKDADARCEERTFDYCDDCRKHVSFKTSRFNAVSWYMPDVTRVAAGDTGE